VSGSTVRRIPSASATGVSAVTAVSGRRASTRSRSTPSRPERRQHPSGRAAGTDEDDRGTGQVGDAVPGQRRHRAGDVGVVGSPAPLDRGEGVGGADGDGDRIGPGGESQRDLLQRHRHGHPPDRMPVEIVRQLVLDQLDRLVPPVQTELGVGRPMQHRRQ